MANYTGNIEIAHLLVNGGANVMAVGDSLWNPGAAGRLMAGAMRSFRPAGGWKGWGGAYNQVNDGAYYALAGALSGCTRTARRLYPSSGDNPVATTSTVTPGDYLDATNTWNKDGTTQILEAFFTGDVADGSTLATIGLFNSGGSSNWGITTPFAGRTMAVSASFLKVSAGHQSIGINIRYLDNVGSLRVSTTSSYVSTRSAITHPEGRDYIRVTATQPSAMLSNDTEIRIHPTTGTYTENASSSKDHVYLVGWRLFDVNATRGMELSYAGAAGYTTHDHFQPYDNSENGLSYVDSSNGKYTENALLEALTRNDINVVLIQLGQNIDSTEGSSNNIGSYKANIAAIMDRYQATAARIDGRTLKFVLVSTWETAGQSLARKQNIATALSELAVGNPNALFLNLQQEIYDVHGAESVWGGTYLADGVHTNLTGGTEFARLLWGIITRANEAYILRRNNRRLFAPTVDLGIVKLPTTLNRSNNAVYTVPRDPAADFTDWEFVSSTGKLYTFRTTDAGLISKNNNVNVDTANRTTLIIQLPAGETWQLRTRQGLVGRWSDYASV